MSQKTRSAITSEIASNFPDNTVGAISAADLRAVTNDLNDSCFNLTSDIPIRLDQGGTGQITANNALNALLPSQAGFASRVLTTNGTNTSWQTGGSGTPGGVTGSVQYNNGGVFGGFGSWNGTVFNVGGALVSTQYSNTLGSAFINPDGSAVFAGGAVVISNTGVVTGTTFNGLLATSNVSQFTNDAGYGTFTLPSLTSGSVLFSNGTTIAQNNSNFFWDNTNLRLALGTTSPQATFDIGGGITTISGGLSAAVSLITTNTNSISGTELRNINTGTTAEGRIAISDQAGNNYVALSVPAGANTGTVFGMVKNTTVTLTTSGASSTRNLSLGTIGANSLVFGTTNAERMRILAGGNVGINNSSPAALLDIAGNAGTADFRISRVGNSANYISISAIGGSAGLETSNISIKGTTIMSLIANGNVNITGKATTGASTTSFASLNLPSGTAPTAPITGDMWFDGTHLQFRIGTTTFQLDQQGGGTVTSVNGTTNRITSTGGATPVIDISAAYVGQTSITTLGTIATGTWQGTVLAGQYGGTGVANTGKTITLGGNLTTSGAFAATLTMTAATTVTLPTTGTLATLAGTETLTNKTVNGVTLTAVGSATTYLNGAGAYTTPAGGSSAFSALTSGTNTAAAMVVGSGATLAATGTGTITATAIPVGGITGLGTGVATFLTTPTSANLATAVTDETGSGALVFGTSPVLTSIDSTSTIQLSTGTGTGTTIANIATTGIPVAAFTSGYQGLVATTIPGNALISGKSIKWRFQGITASTANTKTVAIEYPGGTAIKSMSLTTSSIRKWYGEMVITWASATTFNWNFSSWTENGINQTADSGTGTVTNHTAANVMRITCTVGAANDVTQTLDSKELFN